MTISNQKLAKGWNIEVSASQFEYLCEVLMEANAMDVAEQKEWDIQTFDNLIDNVCNARETYLSRNCKGVYAIVEGKIEKQ